MLPRILVAECLQEISSFNPVPSGYDLFVVLRGDEVLDTQRGLNTFVAGALEVFDATPGVERTPQPGCPQGGNGLYRYHRARRPHRLAA